MNTIRSLSVITATAFILLGIFTFSASADALILRKTVNATSDVVRFSDFFEGAGTAGDTALFRSPRPGRHGSVRVRRLITAVERLGFSWTPPRRLKHIQVTRNRSTIKIDAIAAVIRTELTAALPEADDEEDLEVILPASLTNIRISDSNSTAMVINQLDLSPRTKSFRASMVFGEGQNQSQRTIEGRYTLRRKVPVMNKPIARDQIITANDIDWTRIEERAIGRLITSADDLIGMAARRRIVEFQPLNPSDIEEPNVVTRNQLVTIVYHVPGMTLTARGRALRDAAEGASVSVLNLSSNRTIQTTAIGPGQVAVGAITGGLRVASKQ